MGVDHGGLHIAVAQQLLNRADVGALLQQVCGEGMAEGVADRYRALDRLQEKTDRYAKQIGVMPTGMSVRNFKSRWGPCDKKGRWSSTGTSLRHPPSDVDYVLIHELCNLIHPNHSKDF
jgi:hypothetical protein